jgi:uncharacterized protein (TIGR02246 family)
VYVPVIRGPTGSRRPARGKDHPTGTSSATAARDEQAVRAVLDRLYDAWVARDADAFAADYAEDATPILPGSYDADRNAIRDRMAGVLDGPTKGSRMIDEVQSMRFLGDDAAAVVSRSLPVMPGEDEDAIPADRRRDARWPVAAFHHCATA